jgi:hypothetical protein
MNIEPLQDSGRYTGAIFAIELSPGAAAHAEPIKDRTDYMIRETKPLRYLSPAQSALDIEHADLVGELTVNRSAPTWPRSSSSASGRHVSCGGDDGTDRGS